MIKYVRNMTIVTVIISLICNSMVLPIAADSNEFYYGMIWKR